MKVLHHHCYLDDFLKLFRAAFTDCISSFASAKKNIAWLEKQTNTQQVYAGDTNKSQPIRSLTQDHKKKALKVILRLAALKTHWKVT